MNTLIRTTVVAVMLLVFQSSVYASPAAVAAATNKEDDEFVVGHQYCPPDGFFTVSLLPLDHQAREVSPGQYEFCLAGKPAGLLNGPSCSGGYGSPNEYVKAKSGKPNAVYAGMGVVHRYTHPEAVTLFFCVPH